MFVHHQLCGLGRRPSHSRLSLFFYEVGMKVLSPEVTGRIKLENTSEGLVQNKSLASLCTSPPDLFLSSLSAVSIERPRRAPITQCMNEFTRWENAGRSEWNRV